VAQ
jgi:hypothetical protein